MSTLRLVTGRRRRGEQWKNQTLLDYKPAFPTLRVCKMYFAITILPTTFHIQLTIPDASIQNKFALFGPVQIFLPLDGADH